MLRKNWKTVFLIFLLMLFMTACFEDCNPAGPDDPPEPAKKYDLEVTYIRTEISNPSRINGPVMVALYLISKAGPSRITYITLTKINDYNLIGEFSQTSSNGSETYYAPHTMDMARYDGSNMDSAIVGDRIIIKVKQTGFEKELKDIRKNTFSFNPYQGPKAKIACFILTREGTIISEASTYW